MQGWIFKTSFDDMGVKVHHWSVWSPDLTLLKRDGRAFPNYRFYSHQPEQKVTRFFSLDIRPSWPLSYSRSHYPSWCSFKLLLFLLTLSVFTLRHWHNSKICLSEWSVASLCGRSVINMQSISPPITAVMSTICSRICRQRLRKWKKMLTTYTNSHQWTIPVNANDLFFLSQGH